jgi:hypothetical protein
MSDTVNDQDATLTPALSQPATGDAAHGKSHLASDAATIGVILVGAALIESALVPGILIGVAAMAAPPLLKSVGVDLGSSYRGTYSLACSLCEKTRSTMVGLRDRIAGSPGRPSEAPQT